ncbi:T9SS-dependent choice-of-anchor J family protein [Chryseolinea lacunae]|uniref:Choice-of-anchor J domain-containing protein n=1 Tax=Chryseolinea lacunae TaxID=2801331 RepID=A0ABS1KMJ1_9BACT|nr:choice-of-anchor J domain-containing protein [Chryseolinea lacunae]MBL0740554.1 choice-of-anchor J domain-containing protein [Chryseolinea lacunae]
MDRIFTVFFSRVGKVRIGIEFRKGFMAVVLAMATLQARAQDPTFYETFDGTASGEVPVGWKSYSLNGDQGNGWVRSVYGFFGPKVMTSGVEYALPGKIDEDWLVTPQITPRANDYLIFDSGQEFVWDDYGSTYEVRISTKTANRADFTTVLKSYTEPEFPGYLYSERLLLNLAAYKDKPIYIAFVHKNPVTGESSDPENPFPRSENWYLDNVWVRAVQPLDYTAGEIFGSFSNVIRVVESGTTVIISVVVRTAGDNGSADISALTFTTAASSPKVKIKKAMLYTTYGDSFLSTNEETGEVYADVYGSITDPGNEFTIEGFQDLARGDNYFWLMYTLEADDAVLTFPYPEVDATFERVVVNGVEHATTLSTTAATHAVVPDVPVNDNYADAIEIEPSPGTTVHTGSYNYKATFETEIVVERLAYCATPNNGSAKDGSNSVWWHFKAPAAGVITVDLSTSKFNTMLLIQDVNGDQLACSKDIDESALVLQSRISNFPVANGQEFFIRVTGEGAGPGDPNAANGVVNLDFTFEVPLGVEGPFSYELSELYPNPTNEKANIDMLLHRPTNVVLEVTNTMGQTVHVQDKGFMPAGKHERVELDVAHLPAGPYVVRLRGSNTTARKLMVVKDTGAH